MRGHLNVKFTDVQTQKSVNRRLHDTKRLTSETAKKTRPIDTKWPAHLFH